MAAAAAQALSLPIHDSDSETPRTANRRSLSVSASPVSWRDYDGPLASSILSDRPRTAIDRWTRSARRMRNKGQKLFMSLTPLQRTALLVANAVLLVGLLLFAIFHEPILHWAAGKAKAWRHLPAGWLILWVLVVFVSFPPVIGYSFCVTISGFVWGMHGWWIVSTGSVVGSTLAFVVSRTLLKDYVSRLTEKNRRFAALALVLKHDGLKLLAMIRLCPLPYSLSNGAISTIPTVKWYNFTLATLIVTPKLLLHVFIGRQLGILAEEGAKMDMKTRIVSYVSIAIGMVVGLATGYFIYIRTRARAAELEAEEAAAANVEGRPSSQISADYADDPVERQVVRNLRRKATDVSLHTQRGSDDVDTERGYRDEFTDDEDALERDVFDIGDGELSDEENTKPKH